MKLKKKQKQQSVLSTDYPDTLWLFMFLAHSLEVAEHSKESAVCRSGAPRSVTSSRLDDAAHLSSLWCDNLELKGEHKEMIGNLT